MGAQHVLTTHYFWCAPFLSKLTAKSWLHVNPSGPILGRPQIVEGRVTTLLRAFPDFGGGGVGTRSIPARALTLTRSQAWRRRISPIREGSPAPSRRDHLFSLTMTSHPEEGMVVTLTISPIRPYHLDGRGRRRRSLAAPSSCEKRGTYPCLSLSAASFYDIINLQKVTAVFQDFPLRSIAATNAGSQRISPVLSDRTRRSWLHVRGTH